MSENTEPGNESLAIDFQKILDLYEELKCSTVPTNDAQFQKKVTDGIIRLEEMTRQINMLGLFSTNESIEEVTTENLKYLIVPAILADFSLRNQQFDRLDMLEHAEIYYKDYIQRLNDYGVCSIELNQNEPDLEKSDSKTSTKGLIKKDPLIASAIFRESKINRFKESKRVEEQLSSLKRLICEQENKGHSIDEDLERKFYITLITQWLNLAVDELASIEMEKPMAKMRASMLSADKSNSGSSRSGDTRGKSKPFKPIIITRDAVQKKVYGLGYPSIPTVTVDEFIGQKISDGSLAFNDKRVYGNSLYDWADNPEKKKQMDISEEEQKEILIEKDDPNELEKKRQWDDWKDTHRRGEGNRYNMG
ncbi:hypothetical protein RDWZM_003997 [Blomia tropicalis]|uniref:Uncharacterized protein n=1 Tax=Blomia tropicalis TaxID=40697 RepID=A0A9Q0MJ97_BLOTA|nr:Immunoglobulin (CD79A) binding protein 1 [Blomia tropicalis]KAJ6225452.1 hypothetical protein RDWZM_003997 [Blomia tropicalis]